MKEMFDYAQKNPAKLVWAYTPASTSYFFFKGILKAAGIKADLFREVSIEGTGEQMKDLLGKHIDVILSNVASGGEYVKEGKIKFLSIAYDKRIPQISNVPTLKESGIPYVFSTNRGVFAPKGTPRDRIETLARAFEKACASGDIMKKIEEMGSIIDYKGPKDFTLFVEELDAFYKEAMQ
jgi:tripartite-type tricarboxylate transporter receptor subunit TctC